MEDTADTPDEPAHSIPPDVAVRLLRALDQAPNMFVTLIDADLRSRWLSTSARWVTGTDPEERPGRDALERVHPDDAVRIVHGLEQLRALTTDDGSPAPIPEPLRYRLQRPDGTWLTVEALAQNLFQDPIVKGLLVLGRQVGGHFDGASHVVDLLVADAPLPDVLSACAQLVPALVGEAAVIGLPGNSLPGAPPEDAVVGVLDGSAAARLVADDRWWRPVVEDGEPRLAADFAGVPDDLAGAARAEGFHTAWAVPLTDTSAGEPIGCVVAWSRLGIEYAIGTEAGILQAGRLATLVLGEKRREAALRREAMTDPLTGLGNRSALRRRLDAAGGAVTVALIDLDGFKPVNDTHGHDVGDIVLEAVARRLLAGVRDDDCVVRFGGDEFAVVFGDDMPAEAAAGSADRLHAAIEAPITIRHDLSLQVGASIGLATAAPREVIERADHALYEIKRDKLLDASIGRCTASFDLSAAEPAGEPP